MPQPQPQRNPTPTIDSQAHEPYTHRERPPPPSTLAPHTPPPATSPSARWRSARAAPTPRSSGCSSTPEQAPSCSTHPAALGARWRHAGPGDLGQPGLHRAALYAVHTAHGRSRRPGTRRVAPYREGRPWGLLGARVCTRGSPLQTPHICSIVHLHARAPHTVAFARALRESRASRVHTHVSLSARLLTTHTHTHTGPRLRRRGGHPRASPCVAAELRQHIQDADGDSNERSGSRDRRVTDLLFGLRCSSVRICSAAECVPARGSRGTPGLFPVPGNQGMA
jgi:hypothetical protein